MKGRKREKERKKKEKKEKRDKLLTAAETVEMLNSLFSPQTKQENKNKNKKALVNVPDNIQNGFLQKSSIDQFVGRMKKEYERRKGRKKRKKGILKGKVRKPPNPNSKD